MPDSAAAAGLAREERVVILAPRGRDAAIAGALLAEDGLASEICRDLPSLVGLLAEGAGLVLVTQEALVVSDLQPLTSWLAGQPAWSDLPFIVLTESGGGAERNPESRRLVFALGNVTLLERPFHPLTLVSVARTARRGRRRQYQARAQLLELASRQREIEDSRQRFQALADNIPVLSWTAQADGSIFWYNSRWYEYTGTDFAQMEGWGWQSVHDPASLPAVLAQWQDCIASGQAFEMTFPLRGADGLFRPFLTRVAPLHDEAGRVVRWLGTNTDVSLLQQTQAALAESQAQLQATFDTVPVGIIFAEAPSGRLVFGNAAVQRVFHHPMRYSRDVEDHDLWEAYDEAGSRIPAQSFPLTQTLATGEPCSGEFHFACGDGVRRWIGISSAPVRDGDLHVTGAVVVCTDIDDVRRAQSVLSRDKRALEALVSARTQELEATQARLAHAQRMEALGQLAGGIAHDFNNVIQAVQGGARLIERNPEDTARVRSLAGMITEATARGSAVTRRLLAFSRRGDLRAEPVEPVALLLGMRDILTHTLGAGIAVEVVTPDGLPDGASLPVLSVDKGQLETVLVNLATNARDAMQGIGTLTLTAALGGPGRPQPEDRPLSPEARGYVRLAVSDTGAGMPPDVLARASEPFFTTKEVGEGTGLGLAMARGFAEQSGGGLHIDSEPGRGTTVSLWLPIPVAPATPAATPEVVPPAIPRGPLGARLLLVDDERLVRDTLAQQMTDEGFAVQVAAGGAEALARLEGGDRFDLVIADLSMPGMDGVTLIRELQGRQPGLPAILLTGFATDTAEVAMRGEMQGRFTLLRKPVDGPTLAERAAVMLEG